jgi:hypothetical protein
MSELEEAKECIRLYEELKRLQQEFCKTPMLALDKLGWYEDDIMIANHLVPLAFDSKPIETNDPTVLVGRMHDERFSRPRLFSTFLQKNNRMRIDRFVATDEFSSPAHCREYLFAIAPVRSRVYNILYDELDPMPPELIHLILEFLGVPKGLVDRFPWLGEFLMCLP